MPKCLLSKPLFIRTPLNGCFWTLPMLANDQLKLNNATSICLINLNIFCHAFSLNIYESKISSKSILLKSAEKS